MTRFPSRAPARLLMRPLSPVRRYRFIAVNPAMLRLEVKDYLDRSAAGVAMVAAKPAGLSIGNAGSAAFEFTGD